MKKTQTAQLFQDAYETPSGLRNINNRSITEETITPNMFDFNTVHKPKKENLIEFIVLSTKMKVPVTDLSKCGKTF